MTAQADQVSVVAAKARCQEQDCTIDVTLRHADSGWDHYADYWRVLDADKKELGRRVLHHPHVDEQPFTRRLTLRIQRTVKTVWIAAHDSVHGENTQTYRLDLPAR